MSSDISDILAIEALEACGEIQRDIESWRNGFDALKHRRAGMVRAARRHGWSHRDIADAMQVSEQSVRNYIR